MPGGCGWPRGVDRAKDQSYVLGMLGQDQLARIALPIGAMTKAEVRAHAAGLGLRTAAKADSQDVCFIASTVGRRRFLTTAPVSAPASSSTPVAGPSAGSTRSSW